MNESIHPAGAEQCSFRRYFDFRSPRTGGYSGRADLNLLCPENTNPNVRGKSLNAVAATLDFWEFPRC